MRIGAAGMLRSGGRSRVESSGFGVSSFGLRTEEGDGLREEGEELHAVDPRVGEGLGLGEEIKVEESHRERSRELLW